MKLLVILCVLTLVALSSANPQGHVRGCIYIDGICVEECEEGTTSYESACGPVTPEPTCDNPNPKPEEGDVCDYSACYCESPAVRDPVSKLCVTLDKCTKKNEV